MKNMTHVWITTAFQSTVNISDVAQKGASVFITKQIIVGKKLFFYFSINTIYKIRV